VFYYLLLFLSKRLHFKHLQVVAQGGTALCLDASMLNQITESIVGRPVWRREKRAFSLFKRCFGALLDSAQWHINCFVSPNRNR
jgi:hypothetical protein